MVKYNLCIKVKEGDNLVEGAQEALVAWFTKIKEINKNAIVYPWLAADQNKKEKCIEKPNDIPFLLSNMKKYLHKLYI